MPRSWAATGVFARHATIAIAETAEGKIFTGTSLVAENPKLMRKGFRRLLVGAAIPDLAEHQLVGNADWGRAPS
jgi:hypothetical protein